MSARYNRLIHEHEEATKDYARADTHGSRYGQVHGRWVATGSALDEYVADLEARLRIPHRRDDEDSDPRRSNTP